MHLQRADNHTWRKAKSGLASTVAFFSALLVIAPLGLVFFHLLVNGASSVNWNFFTKLPTPVGVPGGGMVNAIVGSLELLASPPRSEFRSAFWVEFILQSMARRG